MKEERIWDHPPPPRGAAQRGAIKKLHRPVSNRSHIEKGISLPPENTEVRYRTPRYLRTNNSSTQPLKSRNIEERQTITFLRIGDPVAPSFVHSGANHVPDLPKRLTTPLAPYRTWSGTRPETAQATLSTKYFGQSGDVIGCFTSTAPLHRHAYTRPVTAVKPTIEEKPHVTTPRREVARKRQNAFFGIQ